MSAVTEARREAAALDAAAAAAEADAAGLEAAALDRGEDIDLADVEERQERARGLRWRARSASKRAERTAEADRLAVLGELRARIEAYAATAGTGPLEECLDVIRTATARFCELAAAHNETVTAFAEEARAAGVEFLPPSGVPRTDDGGVGRGNGSVAAGSVSLVLYPALGGLPATVAAGEPVTLPEPVSDSGARPRPDHVVYSVRGGAYMTLSGPLGAAQRQQIAGGELIELDDLQAQRWLDGREPFGPGDIEAARTRQMTAAAAQAAAGRQAAIAARQAAELALAGQWSSPPRSAAHSGRGNP